MESGCRKQTLESSRPEPSTSRKGGAAVQVIGHISFHPCPVCRSCFTFWPSVLGAHHCKAHRQRQKASLPSAASPRIRARPVHPQRAPPARTLDASAATAHARTVAWALGPRSVAARRGPTRSSAARPLGSLAGEEVVASQFSPRRFFF